MHHATAVPMQKIEEFFASHGGPFYELQRRLKLLHEHRLMTGRRVLVFIGLAWLVPLMLGSFALDGSGWQFLADPGTWAKFFIAIGAFFIAEQQVEIGLHQKLRQLVSAPILTPLSIRTAAVAVNKALRRRNSKLAEVACLILAFGVAAFALDHLYSVSETSWAVAASASGNTVSTAGWWSILVSVPIFWFLALRGLWRHLVWSLLLREVAQLELKLVATHPDRNGGIGFLAEYPNAYMTFVFGLSCAIASAVGGTLLTDTASSLTISLVTGGWLVLVVLLFAFPLSAFSEPLIKLKRKTLARLGAQATRYHRMAERKLVGTNIVFDDPDGADNAEGIGDPTKQYELAEKLSTMLLDHKTLLPVMAAALLPFAILASTRVPLKEVLSLLKKLLLL